MNAARTAGVGQQVFANYYAKSQPSTKSDSSDARFSGKANPFKSASTAQVLFGFAPDPTDVRVKQLEEEVLKGKSPVEQILYRLGQIANGGGIR